MKSKMENVKAAVLKNHCSSNQIEVNENIKPLPKNDK